MKPKSTLRLLLPALFLSAGLSNAATITFEAAEGYTVANIGTGTNTTNAPFTGQQGWSQSASSGTGAIITTTNSGAYVGGRALTMGNNAAGGLTYIGGKLGIVDKTASQNTITFDARWSTSNNYINVGYFGDSDNDLDPSTDLGMRFGGDGGFDPRLIPSSGSGEITPTVGYGTATFTLNSWYRFNVTIGEVLSGNRAITLSVFNLTTNSVHDINSGAGTTATYFIADSAFGVAPEDAAGGWVRITGNSGSGAAIDNLSFTAIPEPSTALLGGLGLLALLRRRRA